MKKLFFDITSLPKEIKEGQKIIILSDTSLNIEVNNNSSIEVLERNMEYAHRLFSKKVKRGSAIVVFYLFHRTKFH